MKSVHKKTIVIIVVLASIVALLVVVFIKFSKSTTYTSSLDESTIQSKMLAVDTDSDGLKDWEEQLWKTDPKNPDSDGDGALDGEEIKTGRDPLKAGPNDKLDTDTITAKINPETESDLSETDKFSRELFVKIIAAGESDTPPTEADYENFLNQTIQQQIDAQKIKNYTSEDVKVDAEETPEKIRAYGNTIASILTKKPPQKLEFEIAIVDRAQTKNDPEELKKLEPLIAEYKRIEHDLIKVTVPKSALKNHLLLINATTAMAWSITGLEYVLSDPLKALPGVTAYSDNADGFQNAIRSFKSYFDSAGIIFQSTDSGYQFFDTI
ncbi:MAG: hypothetical protein V4467_02920 [Patescibacteria group bacterium]